MFVILFVVAYVLMVYAVCGLLRSGTRQLETDYPLTEPPANTGQNGPESSNPEHPNHGPHDEV